MAEKDNQSLAAIVAALTRIEQRLAHYFPLTDAACLEQGVCWRWQANAAGGELLALSPPAKETLSRLVGLDDQIAAVDKNTRHFLAGKPANHVLLTGGRGCGKSTVIRGIFGKYQHRGLRLIETDAAGLAQLARLQPLLAARREKYILYCDDLSFGESSQLVNRIKNAVEGALTSPADNLLIYATSNRRNLFVETFSDSLPSFTNNDEVQPLETIDEKIALADRFGLWLSFYAPDSEQYREIATHWLRHFGIKPTAAVLTEAQNFADQRGSRNGRIAYQFAVSKIR